MPEEEKKEEKAQRIAVDLGKDSPPPEPVSVSPFPNRLKEGLTRPPPEPVNVSPFQTTATAQSKSAKEDKKPEGQQ